MSESRLSEAFGPPLRSLEPERGGAGLWAGPGLLLTGLAVVALGWLAWSWLGPDLIRYMKIRNM